YLRAAGVQAGDRVVAFLPNIPEASIAFMAACSIGAVWSSCSPDFGASSVVDRFQQIEPKIIFAVDGYQYNGKAYDKKAIVADIIELLPSVEQVVFVPYLDTNATLTSSRSVITWTAIMASPVTPLSFERVSFDHPLWVLYSSGTTGKPKAITHGHGGALLEHYKYLAFHNDVHLGERFFWYSTTGWMMWNYVQAALLAGATIVLYDGSPSFPNLNVLWELAEQAGIHHFGTSAPFLVACMKKDLAIHKDQNLAPLRSISSTGAPLPPEAFDYIYEKIKEDLWLVSMSGGTDVCTAFVGGNPILPVYEGHIQCRALGCALEAWDEDGLSVENEVGEMVITKPMPSMPIYFWNDPDDLRYLTSYFAKYEGVWRHGDWVKITPRKSLIIYGRSDATLNRQGIRIGTAEIYRSVNKIAAIADSLVVNLELSGGRHYMPLFVVLNESKPLTETISAQIKGQLRADYTPRHVPDDIVVCPEIPYTISGKKLEAPVKKILLGIPTGKAANKDAMRNPWSLDFFIDFAKELKETL
ncbi:MAG: acetoacetate--CoA ligase, partial [Bacteroidota bacterium]